MSFRISVNRREVRNPVVRLLVALVVAVFVLVVMAGVFFLLLPLVWFLMLSAVLVTLMLLLFLPRAIVQYRVIVLNRKSAGRRN